VNIKSVIVALALFFGGNVLATESAKPLLLANYYIWYADADGYRNQPYHHWLTDQARTNYSAKGWPPDGPRAGDAASVLWPLAGLYDSRDPEVLDWHVRLAKAAGIDAFVVSWFGEDRMYASFDVLLEKAQLHQFKIAKLDELAQFGGDWENYKRDSVKFLKRYGDQPAYLKIDGKPVVYLYQTNNARITPAMFTDLKAYVEADYGPVYWIMDKLVHNNRSGGDPDLLKTIPSEWLNLAGPDSLGLYSTFSHFRANTHAELAGKYAYLTKIAHDAGKKMLLPVHPGHDNSGLSSTPYQMDRRNGDTFRDFLRAATEAKADFVMVTSFNEWPESTVIEPSSSWADPYQYLKILADWKGVTFMKPEEPKRIQEAAK